MSPRSTTASRSRGGAPPPVPLDRVIDIAEFRARLRTFLRHTEHAARRWGLTPQRYALLLAIKGAPDGSEQLTVTELAVRLQLTRNSVTELVTRAEEGGLVRRTQADHDQRVVLLTVTPEGERRLMGVLVENEEARRELARAFDEVAATFRTATDGEP
jgi:DNA-binding MarR family transcriptional regulator